MKLSKKTAKIINIVIIAMVALFIMSNFALAATSDGFAYSSITATQSSLGNSIQNIAGSILGVVQVIGIAVAIIMLIVLAIKYISAAPNDKAEIKKHAVVYVVGAVILFAAAGIVELIKGWAGTAI